MGKNGVFLRLDRSEGVVDGFSAVRGDSEKVHVLAVDDSLVDRKVIERLLRITSFKVTSVDSGWRALQFLGLEGEENSAGFDRLKVDLIITDYCMPGMSGYDLLKKIKGSSTFRKVPVVIMSSENVLARIDRCLEEGAEDFIVKPVKLSDIKRLKNAMFGEGRNTSCINKSKSDDSSNRPAPLPPLQPPSAFPSAASTRSPRSPRPEPNKLPLRPGSPPCSPRRGSSFPTSPQSPPRLLPKDKDVDKNSIT